MLNFFKSNWFWLSFATFLIVLSLQIFFAWVLMLSVWFSLFFIFRLTKQEEKLTPIEKQLYLTTVFIYPLAETAIKAMIVKNVIPYSWLFLNRLEHFFWAFSTVIIFLPIFVEITQNFKWWQSLITIIGLICLIGNLNEFFEYYLRVKGGLTNDKLFAIYYWDTIYDMIINIMGGLVGFLTLRWKTRLA